jgi:Ca2+/H+ antiporter, TMEM165/GDT1 family
VAGKHLPERLIQISAAALFLLFGAYMLLESFLPTMPLALMVACAAGVVALLAAVLWRLPQRWRPPVLRQSQLDPRDDAEPVAHS